MVTKYWGLVFSTTFGLKKMEYVLCGGPKMLDLGAISRMLNSISRKKETLT